MSSYDRFVYIIQRAGDIRAVVSRKKSAEDALEYLRSNSMPAYDPAEDMADYMKKCNAEHERWKLERWPICARIQT